MQLVTIDHHLRNTYKSIRYYFNNNFKLVLTYKYKHNICHKLGWDLYVTKNQKYVHTYVTKMAKLCSKKYAMKKIQKYVNAIKI